MHNFSFLIVPDSFKDCLSANEVGESIKKGIIKALPKAKIEIIPMADGGEGTVNSIISVLGGEIKNINVLDPLGRETEAFIGIIKNTNNAVIEMAAASGIEKLIPNERNPWITSTYGTGQLIKKALDLGCTKIIIGIGGSATNDGGFGMAKALGIKFYDNNNFEIKEEGGGALAHLNKIDLSNLDKRINQTEIIVATDVKSPLLGITGASYVFGPQKGADNNMVKQLDYNLKILSRRFALDLNINVEKLEGGGAAGGLGAGLYAFLNAKLQSGIETIINLVGLEEKIKKTDIILTAEGKVDSQTNAGKTPAGIAEIAKKYHKPVFVFTGNATTKTKEMNNKGINALIPISRKPENLENSIQSAEEWIIKSAEEFSEVLKAGFSIKKA